jgi:hypothetical protein
MHGYGVRYSTVNDADKCGPKVRYLCVSVDHNVPLKETFDIFQNLTSIDLI